MSNQTVLKPHWSFWVVCILGLIWNVGGSANYLMQTSMEFVSSMPESHQAIIIDRPAWATAGFAFGVFGGALGCLLLLLRRPISVVVLCISFAGIVVTMLHTANVAKSGVNFSIPEIVVMMTLPLVVALALLLYANSVMGKYRKV